MSKGEKNKIGTLDDQLCFQLYLASRNMMKAYQPLLEQLDLTYPQYLVMLVLWEKKETSVKALGESLGLDSGTLSPLIKRMIEKEFLTKVRDPEDERGVVITLTKTGTSLKNKAQCIPEMINESNDADLLKFMSLLKPLKELNRKLEEMLS